MKRIKLSQNKFALVDDSDFEYLNQWKWFYDNKGYARRSIPNGSIHMHRVINNTPVGMLTDHINRDKLDNRRINLRTVNKRVNNINRDIQSNNNSGHSGIGWYKRTGRWRARMGQVCLGYYLDLEKAIKARHDAERNLRWIH